MTKPATVPATAASHWMALAVAAAWLLIAAGRAGADDDVVVADEVAVQPANGPGRFVIDANGVVFVGNVNVNGVVFAPNANGGAVVVNGLNNNVNRPGAIDQWFFPRAQAGERRKAVELPLALQLAELRRCSNLSDVQANKLAVAMQHDVSRFFDEIEGLRERFPLPGVVYPNSVRLELTPMILKSRTGELCGPDSFFQKTLPRVLADEQLDQYRSVIDERQRRRYLTAIDIALQDLEHSCPFDSRQYETIRRLLAEQPPPAVLPGTQTAVLPGTETIVILVMYRLSQIPADKLEPLFDERQWDRFDPVRLRWQVERQRLIQLGLFEDR